MAGTNSKDRKILVLNLVGLQEDKRIQPIYGCLRFLVLDLTETILKHFDKIRLFIMPFSTKMLGN
jgi:hypothetical protein